MRGDGLVAPLLSKDGVLKGAVVTRHGCTDRSPSDAVAGLIQTHQRRFQPAAFRQQVRLRDVNVLQRQT